MSSASFQVADASYNNSASSPKRHFFHNLYYDSVYEVTALNTQSMTLQGTTADVDTLSTTSVFLYENYHPPVDACSDSGTTYTYTSPRWSGGDGDAGFTVLIQIPVEEPITDGWEVQIQFSEPLTYFALVGTKMKKKTRQCIVEKCLGWDFFFSSCRTYFKPIVFERNTCRKRW